MGSQAMARDVPGCGQLCQARTGHSLPACPSSWKETLADAGLSQTRNSRRVGTVLPCLCTTAVVTHLRVGHGSVALTARKPRVQQDLHLFPPRKYVSVE